MVIQLECSASAQADPGWMVAYFGLVMHNISLVAKGTSVQNVTLLRLLVPYTQLQYKATTPPTFTKKENTTLAQWIKVLEWHHTNSKNQMKMANHLSLMYPNLKITQLLVPLWLKDKAKRCKEWEMAEHKCDWSAKWVWQTEHPKIPEMMYLWVSKTMGNGILLTSKIHLLRHIWTVLTG